MHWTKKLALAVWIPILLVIGYVVIEMSSWFTLVVIAVIFIGTGIITGMESRRADK